MTPTFGHGQLRLYLLALLDDAPAHGYDIIKALSDRFGGTYQPSPGTIYPRLARLEDEGLVSREEDGRKSVYRITPAGRAELDARRDELATVEAEIAGTVRGRAEYLRVDVADSMADLKADLRSAAKAAQAGARAADWPGDAHYPDGAPWKDTGKANTKARVKEAEMHIDMFRAQIRSELRVLAIRDDVTEAMVADIRDSLGGILDRVRAVSGSGR